MPWRYQPVFKKEVDGSLAFSLCEVHFASDDMKLESWSEPFGYVVGNDIGDLCGELTHMLMDARCWVPVDYDQMTVGMTFERAVSQDDRNAIADMIGMVEGAISAKRQGRSQ